MGIHGGRYLARWLGVAMLLMLALGPPAIALADSFYEYQSPSWDGTGKVYMGREIAPVMGYQGAGWLERASRMREEKPEKLVQLLPLSKGDTVADIGAGTGYISFRLASALPLGQVLAVDVQPQMVDILTQRVAVTQVKNVLPIQADERSPHLTPESVDLALMVDVYHELAYPREMLEAIATALKPHGKLVLAEYKAENPRVMIKPLHKMSQPQIRAELEAAGFHFQQNISGLPQQHFMVFEKA